MLAWVWRFNMLFQFPYPHNQCAFVHGCGVDESKVKKKKKNKGRSYHFHLFTLIPRSHFECVTDPSIGKSMNIEYSNLFETLSLSHWDGLGLPDGFSWHLLFWSDCICEWWVKVESARYFSFSIFHTTKCIHIDKCKIVSDWFMVIIVYPMLNQKYSRMYRNRSHSNSLVTWNNNWILLGTSMQWIRCSVFYSFDILSPDYIYVMQMHMCVQVAYLYKWLRMNLFIHIMY